MKKKIVLGQIYCNNNFNTQAHGLVSRCWYGVFIWVMDIYLFISLRLCHDRRPQSYKSYPAFYILAILLQRLVKTF